MVRDLWLPNGYVLPDGSKVKSCLYQHNDWQVLDTTGEYRALLARPSLVEKWDSEGLFNENLFVEIPFGSKSYFFLKSRKEYALEPVDKFNSLVNKVDGIAFALALGESRKLTADASFHDSVYVEQYSRLLPIWSITPSVDDKKVLGTWIAGGVQLSTDSFRRLLNLTSWMRSDELLEIIKAAGLSLPSNAQSLVELKKGGEGIVDKQDSVKKKSADDHVSQADSSTFKLSGRPTLEAFFNEHVIEIINEPLKYQALGIHFPSAIILHGPPGCGKTYAVEKLVEFLDWPEYSIDSNSIGSPYIHETSKKISEIFDKAIDHAPSIIVIDEMESFLTSRQSSNSSGLHHVQEVAEFLRRIPEAISANVLVVGMTNHIDMIDPAFLRRGRFDHIIEVAMPSVDEVTSLIEFLLSKLPTADDLRLDVAIENLTGRALSDSAFLIREASRIAARSGKSQLDQVSVDSALEAIHVNKKTTDRPAGFIWAD